MITLCRHLCWLSVLLLLPLLLHAENLTESLSEPVDLEFSGYRLGQSPSANMTCASGACKSQAADDDGRLGFPFSVYETPGALTSVAGLSVVRPRYTFWEEQLYRVTFQIDCAPLKTDECLDDIVEFLDREYGLTLLSTSDIEHFVMHRRQIVKEFVADSGAIVKIRATMLDNEWQRPMVDIVDREMADRVGLTLNPGKYRPRRIVLP